MAANGLAPATSLFTYYGPKSTLNGLQIRMPVTPEELEFFAEHEFIRIIPNFSLPDGQLVGIAATYGPFQPNMPVDVPLWLALALQRRKKCRIQPPEWMQPDMLKAALEEEKANPQLFQPLPFYYLEIAHMLFRQQPTETFGGNEQFGQVRGLLEALRKVRYHKIEVGLKKVEAAITIKLNNLAAAECNMIRLLFKGTLDHFFELSKNNRALLEASLTNPSLSSGPLSASLSTGLDGTL